MEAAEAAADEDVVVVTVDRATGVDDMAGVDVIEGATDATEIPILRLGGAADVETIVAVG